MRTRRLLIFNIVALIVIIAILFGGYYWIDQRNKYIKTDNAQVTGQEVVISAPATGKLVDWKGTLGDTFSSGDTIGTVEVPPSAGQRSPVDVKVTAPTDGTVVQDMAVKNQFVAAGTPLAYSFDLKHLWVTANIKETEIDDIKVGQTVDVYVDAFPGSSLTGTVTQIGYATASTFSLLPQSNDTANYTKVTQVIPVKISLDGYQGMRLVPGMNVSVRIHK
ncbi:MAG: efflux RND transporter periplasmic adaptor subunit [Alicyclobacillus herbarius]|uniref:HlyD family efflux transporter periplasmic adaptor subunit n=1 Tax=Alicyclobacillus herbarius TaxID=122960 RepID=UPI000425CE06|nr:HlyD family efflux transporter periplasmic adaptor subunit [Alicyclobacillus herbarius]MCL6632105.1 efflux RND transporter periplasmic adaptor subunit [Alicyclobacillus herbarius]